MRRTRATALVVLLLIPHSTQAQGRDHNGAGLGLVSVSQDPWTSVAAAGPAGGWGVAAASANPAALMFGPAASALFNLPVSEEMLVMAMGVRARTGLGFGFNVYRVPPRSPYKWPLFELSDARRPGNDQEGGAHVTLAARADTSWAIGINLKYLFTTGQPDRIALDVGIRAEGLWPEWTLCHRPDQLLPTTRARWPAGLSAGMAIGNIAVARLEGLLDHDYHGPPTVIAVGASYRPLVTRPLAMAMNLSYHFWTVELEPVLRQRWVEHPDLLEFNYPSLAVGAVCEFYGALELGVGVSRDHGSSDHRTATFFAVGPSFLRLIWSRGSGLRDARFDAENPLNRIQLRLLFPIEAKSLSMPPPEPYDWWPRG